MRTELLKGLGSKAQRSLGNSVATRGQLRRFNRLRAILICSLSLSSTIALPQTCPAPPDNEELNNCFDSAYNFYALLVAACQAAYSDGAALQQCYANAADEHGAARRQCWDEYG